MNINRMKYSLKDLDNENFENVKKAFFDLPEPGTDEYARRIDELCGSLHFNLGYTEVPAVEAVGLDIYGNEIKVIFDVLIGRGSPPRPFRAAGHVRP
jgi:hypothetical protein